MKVRPTHRTVSNEVEFHTLILALALGAALIVSPALRGHIDEGDSQVYQVVARHMVEDHTWFNLRDYVGDRLIWREHLPFGLWPHAAVIQVWGESALVPMAITFSLATIAVVGWLATALAGRSAGLIAMLVLGCNKTYYLFAGRPKLDPLLLLLATVAAAPLFFERLKLRHWCVAAFFGGLAALVKGPFGLLPLTAAIVSRAIVERSIRIFLTGAAAAFLSALPVMGFLLWSKWLGDGSWWRKYLFEQLLASATGSRGGGRDHLLPWYPLSAVYHFGPAFPLILLGVWSALRQNIEPREKLPSSTFRAYLRLRMLTLLCLFILLGLCLPGRKLWLHSIIVYPWLAILAGVATQPYLDRFLSNKVFRYGLTSVLSVMLIVIWKTTLDGRGPQFTRNPCVLSAEFSDFFDQRNPGEHVYVVSSSIPRDWPLAAALAAERRLAPWPTNSLPLYPSLSRGHLPGTKPGQLGVESTLCRPPDGQAPSWSICRNMEFDADIALVQTDALPTQFGPWRQIGRARDWVLLFRPP